MPCMIDTWYDCQDLKIQDKKSLLIIIQYLSEVEVETNARNNTNNNNNTCIIFYANLFGKDVPLFRLANVRIT